MTRPETLPPAPETYTADQARGGEIILRTPTRRFLFLGGLAVMIALALLMAMFS